MASFPVKDDGGSVSWWDGGEWEGGEWEDGEGEEGEGMHQNPPSFFPSFIITSRKSGRPRYSPWSRPTQWHGPACRNSKMK